MRCSSHHVSHGRYVEHVARRVGYMADCSVCRVRGGYSNPHWAEDPVKQGVDKGTVRCCHSHCSSSCGGIKAAALPPPLLPPLLLLLPTASEVLTHPTSRHPSSTRSAADVFLQLPVTPCCRCLPCASQTHIEHCQLQDFIALLLSTRETLVDVPVEEGWVHFQQLKLWE